MPRHARERIGGLPSSAVRRVHTCVLERPHRALHAARGRACDDEDARSVRRGTCARQPTRERGQRARRVFGVDGQRVDRRRGARGCVEASDAEQRRFEGRRRSVGQGFGKRRRARADDEDFLAPESDEGAVDRLRSPRDRLEPAPSPGALALRPRASGEERRHEERRQEEQGEEGRGHGAHHATIGTSANARGKCGVSRACAQRACSRSRAFPSRGTSPLRLRCRVRRRDAAR